jgi:hypothetical protein
MSRSPTAVLPPTRIARWSQEHVHELAEISQRYGLNLKDDPEEHSGC